jgi:hypothetical protein
MLMGMVTAILAVTQCEQFGAELQDAWNRGEQPLETLADVDVVSERVAEGFTVAEAKGVRNSLAKFQLGADLVTTLKTQKAVVVFLRCRDRGGFPTALFSIRYAEGGFNHLELELRRRRNGQLKVVDLLSHFDGVWTSQNIRRMTMLAMGSSAFDPTQWKTLFGVTVGRVEQEAIHRFTEAAKKGNAEETEKSFAALPVAFQGDRAILGLRIAGVASDATLNKRAVEAYLTAFPNDVSSAFKAFDSYFREGAFQACLNALQTIDDMSGGDPFLNVVRARVELQAGHPAKAMELGAFAVQAEPWNHDAYFVTLDAAVAKGDHARTAYWLDSAVRAGVDFTRESLARSTAFSAFLQSPRGKRWRPPVLRKSAHN